MSTELAPATDFDVALRAAVDLAYLAPSSHNSQAWGLAVARSPEAHRRLGAALERATGQAAPSPSARRVVLALDRARELNALRDHRVEMYLSCGAYLHLLLEVLRLRGWGAARVMWNEALRVDWLQPVAPPRRWLPLAVIELSPRPRADRGRLIELTRLVARRTTNRAPYRGAPPADALLAAPAPLPQESSAPRPPVETHVLTDRAKIASIGAFVAANAAIDFAHPKAWRETHRFLRWSSGDHVEDGLPIEQLYGPLSPARKLWHRVTLAPPVLSRLAHVGHATRLAEQLGALVRDSPALAVVSLAAERPTLSETVDGGAALMQLWLRATAAGAALHPISAILQHPDLRVRFQRDHDLPGRVVFFSRLGYPASAFPPAPRRRDPWSSVATL
ncbi:MAG: hypothetical protein R3B48_13545 [Kofleriaceae bacterium]